MSIFIDTINAFTKGQSERLPTTGMATLSQMTGTTPATPVQHMEAYGSIGWLFATVERIAQAVATVEWHLYQRMPNGDRREVDEGHPLAQLWERVSPHYTSEDFRETGQQHMELSGEQWWILITDSRGMPVELQIVRPDRMRPIPDPVNYISHYDYVIGTKKIRLEREDVIFIRRPSPMNPHRGIGPVQSLMYDLGSEKLAAQWTQTFFRNSAEPGGVIEVPATMDDTEYENMRVRWAEQHRGVANAHRVAIIENGKWVERKYTQRDMQFEQLRKLNRDIIVGAFGLPQAMLGVSENVNRANAEAAEVMFGRWVIRPRVVRVRGALNTRLCPLFGNDLFFDFVDPTPKDKEHRLTESTTGYAAGILTLNEARELLDKGEVPEGDEFYAPPAAGGFMLSAPDMKKVLAFGHSASDVRQNTSDQRQKLSVSEKVERTMLKQWVRRLREERDGLVEFIETTGASVAMQGSQLLSISPRTKLELSDLEGYDWDWWTKYSDEVIAELAEAAELAILDTFPEMGSEATRVAAEYARTRGAALLQLTGDINMVALTRRRVNEIVAQAIEQGDSLGTITKSLREDFAFSKERASVVARTETSTAQGQGAQRAAMSQGLTEKSWITQGDALVEAECEMNENVGWIQLSAIFPSGKDTIPQHPNCRCTVLYRGEPVSDIDPGEGLEDEVGEAIEGSRSALALAVQGWGVRPGSRELAADVIVEPVERLIDAVCPRCSKLVQRGVPHGLSVHCPRCKMLFTAHGARYQGDIHPH